MALTGQYSFNGKDLWTTWGVAVLDGLKGFLSMPERKQPFTRDWDDQNGIEVDLSVVYYKNRTFPMSCILIGSTLSDFWTKYEDFYSELMLPGEISIQVGLIGKAYKGYWASQQNLNDPMPVQQNGKYLIEFEITLIETDGAIALPPGVTRVVLTDAGGQVFTDSSGNVYTG